LTTQYKNSIIFSKYVLSWCDDVSTTILILIFIDMLRIRLSRGGKKNMPIYKVVVAEHSAPIKGKFVEQVGTYTPSTSSITLKPERIQYWISVGAKPSVTVHNLLVREGVVSGDKIKVTRRKKKDTET
jgi:small subunit ribosomal protein S16